MPLNDYEFEYTTARGTVLMNAQSAILPLVDVDRVQGLFNMDIRDGDRAFTRGHGDLAGEHLLTPKEIVFDMTVRGDPAQQTYWDLVYDVVEVFTTTQYPSDAQLLKFKVPGVAERFIRARPIRRDFSRSWQSETGLAPVVGVLKAADPRIYAPIGSMNTSGTQSGTFNVTNDGNANAYPKLTFTSTGATITLTNNTFAVGVLTLTSPPTGTLVVDIDRLVRGVNDLIVYVGTTNHYDKWTQPRLPFALGGGINSLTLTGATNVTVEWYHTWI